MMIASPKTPQYGKSTSIQPVLIAVSAPHAWIVWRAEVSTFYTGPSWTPYAGCWICRYTDHKHSNPHWPLGNWYAHYTLLMRKSRIEDRRRFSYKSLGWYPSIIGRHYDGLLSERQRKRGVWEKSCKRFGESGLPFIFTDVREMLEDKLLIIGSLYWAASPK